MRSRDQKSRLLRLCILFVSLGLCAVAYAGFFFTDSRMSREARTFLWTARIGIPLLLIGVFRLARRVRAGKTERSKVFLMLGAMALALILFFPVASHIYHQSLQRRLDEYHPYLQVAPPEFHEKAGKESAAPIRIFCLGGSTTEFTDRAGRGWPDRVEERLKGAGGERPVEVYNLGRQWYTSLHTLINFEVNLRPHKPDIIVVMHAVNDLLHNADFCRFSFGPFRNDYGHFYGPVSRIVHRQSVLQLFLREARSTWYWSPREVVDTHTFPGLEPFTRNLRTLIDLARVDGAIVVFVTQPHLYKEHMPPAELPVLRMLRNGGTGEQREWSPETMMRGMNTYNNAVRQLAAAKSVPLVDLEPLIPKTLEYFYDDVHYRQRTFDLVAEHVSNAIEPLMRARLVRPENVQTASAGE